MSPTPRAALDSHTVEIAKDRRVRIKVTLRNGDQVIEDSAVEYFHGAGKLLSGLEDELEGLTPDQKKSGVIAAEKAFGAKEHQHEKVIPLHEFPKDAKLIVGETFLAGSGTQEVSIRILEVRDTEILALLRHPLADADIGFDVEVLDVTDPIPPPLPAEALIEEE